MTDGKFNGTTPPSPSTSLRNSSYQVNFNFKFDNTPRLAIGNPLNNLGLPCIELVNTTGRITIFNSFISTAITTTYYNHTFQSYGQNFLNLRINWFAFDRVKLPYITVKYFRPNGTCCLIQFRLLSAIIMLAIDRSM